MNEIILAALLREWLGDLTDAIDNLENLPPLKDGRKLFIIKDSPELLLLWNVRISIDNLIDRLEGRDS